LIGSAAFINLVKISPTFHLLEYVGKPALHNLLAAAYLWRAVCLKRHLPDDDAGDKQAGVNLKLQLTDFFASLSASLDVWCSILGILLSTSQVFFIYFFITRPPTQHI
jgi:hypothetical protein